MNQEDYVSYDLALKLKECGFTGSVFSGWRCDHRYYVSKDGKVAFRHNSDGILVQFRKEGRIETPAPTLWQAQKWLRKKRVHLASGAPTHNEW